MHAPHAQLVVLLFFPDDSVSPPRRYDTEAKREGYTADCICLLLGLRILYLADSP